MAGSFAYERLNTILKASDLPEQAQANVLRLLESSETGSSFLEEALSYLSQPSQTPGIADGTSWQAEIASMTVLDDPAGATFRQARDVADRIRASNAAVSSAVFIHASIAQATSDLPLQGLTVSLLGVNQLLVSAIQAIGELPLDDIRATLESIRTNETYDPSVQWAAGHARQLIDAVRGSYRATTLRSLQDAIQEVEADQEAGSVS